MPDQGPNFNGRGVKTRPPDAAEWMRVYPIAVRSLIARLQPRVGSTRDSPISTWEGDAAATPSKADHVVVAYDAVRDELDHATASHVQAWLQREGFNDPHVWVRAKTLEILSSRSGRNAARGLTDSVRAGNAWARTPQDKAKHLLWNAAQIADVLGALVEIRSDPDAPSDLDELQAQCLKAWSTYWKVLRKRKAPQRMIDESELTRDKVTFFYPVARWVTNGSRAGFDVDAERKYLSTVLSGLTAEERTHVHGLVLGKVAVGLIPLLERDGPRRWVDLVTQCARGLEAEVGRKSGLPDPWTVGYATKALGIALDKSRLESTPRELALALGRNGGRAAVPDSVAAARRGNRGEMLRVGAVLFMDGGTANVELMAANPQFRARADAMKKPPVLYAKSWFKAHGDKVRCVACRKSWQCPCPNQSYTWANEDDPLLQQLKLDR